MSYTVSIGDMVIEAQAFMLFATELSRCEQPPVAAHRSERGRHRAAPSGSTPAGYAIGSDAMNGLGLTYAQTDEPNASCSRVTPDRSEWKQPTRGNYFRSELHVCARFNPMNSKTM
jgi:hypothetical protein